MLQVYNASAGSGKTYRLVAEYLKLALESPTGYKNILAVTFTNKATGEMKSRIIEQLYLLANHKNSAYLQELTQALKKPENEIRQLAAETLKNLLHDYDNFSVSTIDSFNQRVIKAFNRELGISPDFTLETDEDLLMDEAVDRLLANIHTDKNLLDWLINFSSEKITNGLSRNIKEDIKSIGFGLLNEKSGLMLSEQGIEHFTREKLDELKKEINNFIVRFESYLARKGVEALGIAEKMGLTVDDFSRGKTGVMGYFLKISKKIIAEPNSYVKEALDSPEKWVTQKHKKRNEIIGIVENLLFPVLHSAVDYYRTHLERYTTDCIVRSQLRIQGIVAELRNEIRELAVEKGILRLSESNLLISRIIGQSETPFIYEKTGSRYKHFMLDEFQDTSVLQWNNFKPLILNSLAEGNSNLLVGDSKQSIYRWRNGDWKILAEKVPFDFPGFELLQKSLVTNWRSEKNIVDFNNSVFSQLKYLFADTLFEPVDKQIGTGHKTRFLKMYEDVEQRKPQDSGHNGHIRLEFIEEKNFEDNTLKALINHVKYLQDNGIKAGETAILLRRKNEGPKLIEALFSEGEKPENKKYNLSVISGESLFLGLNPKVRLVIETLKLIIEPENNISKAALAHFLGIELTPGYQLEFENQITPNLLRIRENALMLPIDETIMEICAEFGLFSNASDIPYLMALTDKAHELKKRATNDISGFLQWWDEKGETTSVNVNENVDSIRILTVHKAKGLEFKAVIIPFFNWPLTWPQGKAPTLWCKSEKEPYQKIPFLPLKAKSEFARSYFKETYFDEIASYYTDLMNLVYVAFTRAVSDLAVFSQKPVENSKKEIPVSLQSLFLRSVQEMAKVPEFENCWDEGTLIFETGGLQLQTVQKETTASQKMEKFEYHNFTKRIKIKSSADRFTDGENGAILPRKKGRIIHLALSYITTIDDIGKACKSIKSEEGLTDWEMEGLNGKLNHLLRNPEVEEWFSGKYTVLNERDILTKKALFRPDRIMIKDNSAIVVDYKSGSKQTNEHARQVQNYARLLKESGFDTVKAYLWYLNAGNTEKVAEF